jgi:hypothetical protein
LASIATVFRKAKSKEEPLENLLFQRRCKQFSRFKNVESQLLWLKQHPLNEIVTRKEDEQKEEEQEEKNIEDSLTNVVKHRIVDYQTENVIDFNRNLVQYASTNHEIMFKNKRSIQADLTEPVHDLRFFSKIHIRE